MIPKRLPHVIPLDDHRAHERTEKTRCWCRPVVQEGMLVHRSPEERDEDNASQAIIAASRGLGWEDLRAMYGIPKDEAWQLVKLHHPRAFK